MRLAIEADPAFWFAYVKLARLQADLGAFAEADKNLDEALRRKPGWPEALLTRVRIAVGRKDWAAARRGLSAMLDADPADLVARRQIVVIDAQLRDWDACERDARLVLSKVSDDRDTLFFLAQSYVERNRPGEARPILEALDARGAPQWEVLALLQDVYVQQKEWVRLRAVLERLLPLAKDEETKKRLAAQVELLKNGPPPEGAGTASSPPPPLSTEQVFAVAAEAADPVVRRQALEAIVQGIAEGRVKQVTRQVMGRVRAATEPDASCRRLVLKILRCLTADQLPLIAMALHDPDKDVRLLAVETLGDFAQPAAVLYLLPLLAVEPCDLAELSAIRKALSSLTGFRDLVTGPVVATEAEAHRVREAWRAWRLSDASIEVNVAAVRQMAALPQSYPEFYLEDFAIDAHFEVMREAYLAMRAAADRPPKDPLERKTLPTFPRVPDAEVTRANMRSLQDRVARWWDDWLVEHRAILKAKGAEPAPAMAGN